jgi:predicted DNA-binding protein
MRGGKRKGAGRKPRSEPLKAVTVRLEPEAVDKLNALCKPTGLSQSKLIAKWILEA